MKNSQLHTNRDFRDHFLTFRDIRDQVFKKRDYRGFKGPTGSHGLVMA